MRQPAQTTRNGTINIRVARETLGLIDRAAWTTGKTRTDFILDAASQAAEDTILDQRLFLADPEQWQAFIDRLDAPLEPNAKLDALINRRPA